MSPATRSVLALCLVCAVWGPCAEAGGECKEQFREVWKAMDKMFDEEKLPQCATKFELDQYRCSAQEADREKHREAALKMKKWFETLSDDVKNEVMDCYKRIVEMAKVEQGLTVSPECEERWDRLRERMLKSN